MPELGFVVYLIAISYAMGMIWYTLLGRQYTSWARMAAFPLVGVVIGQAIWSAYLADALGQGLIFFNLNIYVALIATFAATLVDVAFSWLATEPHVADVLKNFEHPQQPMAR